MRRWILLLTVLAVAVAGCGDSGGGSRLVSRPGGDLIVTDEDGGIRIDQGDQTLFDSERALPDDYPFELPDGELTYFESAASGLTTRTVSILMDGDAAEIYTSLKASLLRQGVQWADQESVVSSEAGFAGFVVGLFRGLTVDLTVASDGEGAIVLIGIGDV